MDHHDRTTARAWLLALRTPAAFYPAILLGLQIVLAFALTWAARGTLDPGAAQGPLLAFDPKAVTSLRLEGAGESVTLARKGQDWLIPELADFPAEGAKVTALIDRLAGLMRVSPVATTAAAQQRHKVADDGFERKVTLMAGDQTLAALLLGDSPGFKRQFARPAGDPAVYDLDLPLFEVGNRRDDWLRRDLLQVDQDQITGVATADWKLVKEKDAWVLADTAEKPDPAAIINLLGRIGALGYRGVLGTEDKPEYNQAAPTLELTVQLAGGGNRVYRISQAKDSKDSILKAADRPWYFKLSASDLEGIAGLNRDRLLGLTPPAADGQGQETGDATAGEDAAAADEQVPQDPEAQREAEQAAAAVDLDDASTPEETDEGAAPQDAEADQTMAPGAPGGQ